MKWNWQRPDWPSFAWEKARLRKAEDLFLLGAGQFAGSFRHLPAEEQNQITADEITTEALNTSEIEGEILDRASVRSSIRRQFGLASDGRRVKPAERGISDMMVSAYRSFEQPLSEDLLLSWHRMLFGERGGLMDVGRYRTGAQPMQVVSGPIHDPKVHFEAPPSTEVPKEMAGFVAWFNRTAPGSLNPLPALTRAGTAHLYFESIHPFEDGNGRIGRLIADKALAQAAGQPPLSSLAETILARRTAYYAALEAANQKNEITAWLAWFAGIAIEGQRRAAAHVEFTIDKTRLLDRLRGQLNARQEKALLRMLREGPEGFKGGLSAGNYVTITGASAATATRDLADLVSKGALSRTGELRHARYNVAIPMRTVEMVVVDEKGNVRSGA